VVLGGPGSSAGLLHFGVGDFLRRRVVFLQIITYAVLHRPLLRPVQQEEQLIARRLHQRLIDLRRQPQARRLQRVLELFGARLELLPQVDFLLVHFERTDEIHALARRQLFGEHEQKRPYPSGTDTIAGGQ
jgi:hypothetical protein